MYCAQKENSVWLRQFRTHDWTMKLSGSQGSYWTNCCKLHCGWEWRKIVTVMIFVCWELLKGSVMSCAVRRLTGIVSVNVLIWHRARGDCVWGCLRVDNWKKGLFVTSSHFQTKYDDLQSIYNMSATLSFKILQRTEIRIRMIAS